MSTFLHARSVEKSKKKKKPDCVVQELCSCQSVILSVEDEAGQRIIIEDLLEATRGADPGLRQAAVTILNAYFARTRLDYSAHIRTLLSGLIRLLNDSNPEVLSQSWDTINSITKVTETLKRFSAKNADSVDSAVTMWRLWCRNWTPAISWR